MACCLYGFLLLCIEVALAVDGWLNISHFVGLNVVYVCGAMGENNRQWMYSLACIDDYHDAILVKHSHRFSINAHYSF